MIFSWAYNFNIFKTNIDLNIFIFVNIVILFSFCGDLIQSYFKQFVEPYPKAT